MPKLFPQGLNKSQYRKSLEAQVDLLTSEIKLKDLLVMQLLHAVTVNNIKLPDNVVRVMEKFYGMPVQSETLTDPEPTGE